jgi:hypothetical protein
MTEDRFQCGERMKSIDRDFAQKWYDNFHWPAAYIFVAAGSLAVVTRLWEEVHLRGLPHALIRIVSFPLIFVCPLIVSLLFRGYIRSALKENLVSERLAKNCEYWIGLQLFSVYILILIFATWD